MKTRKKDAGRRLRLAVGMAIHTLGLGMLASGQIGIGSWQA